MSGQSVVTFRLRIYGLDGVKVGEVSSHDVGEILALREEKENLDSFLDIIWRDVVIFTETRRAREGDETDVKVRFWPDDYVDDGEKVVGG